MLRPTPAQLHAPTGQPVLSLPLFIMGLLLVCMTLLAKVRLHDWWLRACEFPRVQIATVALAVLVLSIWSEAPWQMPTALCCLGVLLIQLYRILPWTRLWKVQVLKAKDVDEDSCIKLLISNVLTPNRNVQGLVEQVLAQRPDVVLTLESDRWWGEQLDAALTDWPHRVSVPQDNLYGMHLYSRLPLEDIEVKRLIQDDIPSIHGSFTLRDGSRIHFHALHPRPPAPNESKESLWRDAELLLVGKYVHDRGEPALLIGDLNDVAWSRTTRTFSHVSGMLDPRCGRGMFNTYNAWYLLLRWPLDHIFVTRHFKLCEIKRLKQFGSDHFPIMATLSYTPDEASDHEKPTADPEEKQEARETIVEARSREQKE